jgi:hypothetical protein
VDAPLPLQKNDLRLDVEFAEESDPVGDGALDESGVLSMLAAAESSPPIPSGEAAAVAAASSSWESLWCIHLSPGEASMSAATSLGSGKR